ncbi:MAG TPA: hypothetical protein VFL91_17735 [Thermomicrobiales bacterium]|nr:hypothetical protein [Thermomicrobiales bacterium]
MMTDPFAAQRLYELEREERELRDARERGRGYEVEADRRLRAAAAAERLRRLAALDDREPRTDAADTPRRERGLLAGLRGALPRPSRQGRAAGRP